MRRCYISAEVYSYRRSDEEVRTSWCRPQSAKHVSNQWLPSHSDHHLQLQKQTNTTVNQQGHKPASNTSNLTRLLPKRIHYDKEKLYYETLQLKTALNVVSDENYKLKTRVAILEKEKERIHKAE